DGNVCDSNVAVGCIGDEHDGGGYKWEAVNNDGGLEGVWGFNGNFAHNNNTGGDVWQNVQMNHNVDNFTAYNNEIGWYHGAYVNAYNLNGFTFYNNPLV